jgi:flagellar biosynthesis/type III secretory pathway M-ring protein FliF/YscJ
MHDALDALARAAATVTPSPTPTLPDPDTVTPGVWGFVAIVFVALAVIALVWDMMRRIRRGRVRADINEELDAEEQAARAVEATETDDQSVDPDDSRERPRG